MFAGLFSLSVPIRWNLQILPLSILAIIPAKFPVTGKKKVKKEVFFHFCCCYHYFQLFGNKKESECRSIILLIEKREQTIRHTKDLKGRQKERQLC